MGIALLITISSQSCQFSITDQTLIKYQMANIAHHWRDGGRRPRWLKWIPLMSLACLCVPSFLLKNYSANRGVKMDTWCCEELSSNTCGSRWRIMERQTTRDGDGHFIIWRAFDATLQIDTHHRCSHWSLLWFVWKATNIDSSKNTKVMKEINEKMYS